MLIYIAFVNLTLQGSAMVRLVALLSICLLFREAAVAQGTYLFTWHGDSNFFRGTFSVTEAEMQPGASLSSSLFFDSLSFTDPSAHTFRYDPSQSVVVGGVNPWAFGMMLVDFTQGTELRASGAEPPVGGMTGLVYEKPFSGADLWYETGHWTYSYVPEPSSLAVCAVAALAFALGRRRRYY
jgi:hypothetical protein